MMGACQSALPMLLLRGDKTLMRNRSGFFARRRLSPHLSLAACRCSLRPDRGSLTFRRGCVPFGDMTSSGDV